jgi:hypothetical protein
LQPSDDREGLPRHLTEGEIIMAKPRSGIQVASGLNIVAGLWVFFSPWIFGFAVDPAAMWASVVSGLIIMAIGVARALRPRTNPGWSWINFIVGLWVVITPWVYGYTFNVPAVWNGVIIGLLVALLALVSVLSGREPVLPPRTG